jgi:hypothetical protein
MRLFRYAVMRLFRYAIVAGVLGIPAAAISVAAAPASYAAVTSGGSRAFATPSAVTPGSRVTFTADCSPAANAGGASATLFGTTLGLPERIPMTAAGSDSFTFDITVSLPDDIAPGTYHPEIDCPGAGTASATLRVTPVPRGGAATGDGATSTTPNNPLVVAGLALAGVGAIAGAVALRRRLDHP